MKKIITMKEITQPHIDRLTATVLAMDWKYNRVYGDWLAQTYYHVRHSTRLLAAAAGRFTMEQHKLHLQCMKHAGEERGHEKLALSDLEQVGFSLQEFPELPATKALYRSQYYLVDRENPIALFGYAYFLEWLGLAAGPQVLAILEPIYGKNAVKHLRVHTTEDIDHIRMYEDQLDTFQGRDREGIVESLETAAAEYERVYQEIAARAAKAAGKKAA